MEEAAQNQKYRSLYKVDASSLQPAPKTLSELRAKAVRAAKSVAESTMVDTVRRK